MRRGRALPARYRELGAVRTSARHHRTQPGSQMQVLLENDPETAVRDAVPRTERAERRPRA